MDEEKKFDPFAPIDVELQVPIEFGKNADGSLTRHESISMTPSARAFREFVLPMTADGKVDYQPYALAQVGIKMAGLPAPFVDKLHPRDLNAIASQVMSFFA